MSKKEANSIDPQQKLLLANALIALEDSGIKYRGKNIGCFIGSGQSDFQIINSYHQDNINSYSAPGYNNGVNANRISYCLNLKGPSFNIDTACSSAGTALGLAYQSLLKGECTYAVVGGINLLMHPLTTHAFKTLGVLSPDCYCKSFDNSADGYVRSEGCAVIVCTLDKRAKLNNLNVYANITSIAMNHDGSTTNTLTLPSQKQIFNLINKCTSKIDTNDIAYVECHATGTAKGDVIETNTVGMALGKNSRKLKIGTIKGNIGHTECSSFLSSLMKVVLMLKNNVLYPNLNFNKPNKKILFDYYNLEVCNNFEPFDFTNKFILINSFGFGGSNFCCLIKPGKDYRQTYPLKKNPFSIKLFRSQTIDSIKKRYAKLNDLDCDYKLNKMYQPYRYFMYSIKSKDFEFKSEPRIHDLSKKKKVVMIFSGQGPQFPEMGCGLYKHFNIFK